LEVEALVTKQQVKDLRRALVALGRDSDRVGDNVQILAATFHSVWTQLIGWLEAEEKRLDIDPTSLDWFRDEPPAPLGSLQNPYRDPQAIKFGKPEIVFVDPRPAEPSVIGPICINHDGYSGQSKDCPACNAENREAE
jgi:hypothetical protein